MNKINCLVVFDIDGTLVEIMPEEDQFYHDAINFVLNTQRSVDLSWENYTHPTDAGILNEIFSKSVGRPPTHDEIEIFINYISKRFEKHTVDRRLNAHPGSETIFQALNGSGFDVAIATGCWKLIAELKLKSAKIPYNAEVIASSSDDQDRAKIIQLAVTRAKDFYNRASYKKVFYVGDAKWDMTAAEIAGVNFIGVGNAWQGNKNVFHILSYQEKCVSKLLLHLQSHG